MEVVLYCVNVTNVVGANLGLGCEENGRRRFGTSTKWVKSSCQLLN